MCSPVAPRSRRRSSTPACRGSRSPPRRSISSGVELEISQGSRTRHRSLKKALQALGDGGPTRQLSYVLIDCPPSLNLLTINALTAADAVVVPLQCEFFALEGLSQLLRTVEQVRSTLNPSARHPRDRADHVRSAQQAFGSGRRGCARIHGHEGLRDDHPAQCAAVGGPLLRKAGSCSTISNAPGARPISNWPPSSSSANAPIMRAISRLLS